MAHALRSERHTESAQFVDMMDRFFDCLNVSSLTGDKKALKKFHYPYQSASDDRLNVSKSCIHCNSDVLWLKKYFLGYIAQWEKI